MTFVAAVTDRTRRLQTRLCVGLDPRASAYRDAAHLRAHTLDVLEAAAPYAACVKPQLAFFEALGLPGFTLLEEVCAAARTLGLPVILDGKRGDIGSTAAAYAQGWLTGPHAGDALTVNPFLGFQTLTPFVEAARANGGGLFVLVKTSNPDQADLQGQGISERVAVEVARLDAQEQGEYASVGAVVGATHPQDLATFRALMPRALLLLPGLGAQGGTAAELAPAFHPGGTGALASASRAVQYADGLDVGASREAARRLRDELNAVMP
ncbi:orotidine-5'-phosphate decarboxylase [Deinococcus metallilatus]|uniref:Orotidine 5'-phosphate decarboxylase n=1 Tax=Deinococcus metallilatus TaxID=1211322 RepID=A0AAJ5JXY2_9DEIO|nr:orotidine-5'-phosphate decarboxylase [Deinococcus metallilatus]MBB5296534.1 orotidine-5'-phosphate decarboxylase [Deinococcus metallilatus]QBY08438.1 orotidine-5'-phosphate decarboxylase [Deinococcus metallilatus]RXJ11237.1 orotidine-5'-phosphate decarboxylase [Deinococcus metallilatus]TLK24728.1 orotidine-5'-phosphate decarboxylase [Deinococcus metallilatus]GMA17452.1 orotidine 5'-phosphate decarboxylase [Deinococcus metallilatus]